LILNRMREYGLDPGEPADGPKRSLNSSQTPSSSSSTYPCAQAQPSSRSSTSFSATEGTLPPADGETPCIGPTARG
jgi:hypothetical protein